MVETMKWNKDTLTDQPSDAAVENVVDDITTMNPTQIGHATRIDLDSAYPASNIPSSRDAWVFYLKWCTTIHGGGQEGHPPRDLNDIADNCGFTKQVGVSIYPEGTTARLLACD